MMYANNDVIGIGNAIVDILSTVSEAFLKEYNLDKGNMTLISAETAEELFQTMPEPIFVPGGSAANTLVGIASLGGDAAYLGKVRQDFLGHEFNKGLIRMGVKHFTPLAKKGPPTAQSLIFVTPDAERTMQTYLGISVELNIKDIDPGAIAASTITYLEGYLFDPPDAKRAFVKAAEIAHSSERKVALSLSDAFCVDRHKDEFKNFIFHNVDFLFANETEIITLFEVEEFQQAAFLVKDFCEIAALTRGDRGSVVIDSNKVIEVPAQRVVKVVDTTGAGDLFAAGFLFGLCRGFEAQKCAFIGSLCASEVIQYIGARPINSLQNLLLESGIENL